MRAAKPSLLQDLENRRPGEIYVINGAVSRMAAKIGMDAPVNATLVALVKQRERSFATS
jgi:2-dehydropantoate 2-reductase